MCVACVLHSAPLASEIAEDSNTIDGRLMWPPDSSHGAWCEFALPPFALYTVGRVWPQFMTG